MPTKKKKFRIVREVTYADGNQTFEVEADDREDAIKLFRAEKAELVETDVEVGGLEDLDEFDFDDMEEVE